MSEFYCLFFSPVSTPDLLLFSEKAPKKHPQITEKLIKNHQKNDGLGGEHEPVHWFENLAYLKERDSLRGDFVRAGSSRGYDFVGQG